ncbi:hypothetical protein PG995_009784 [Apiospora arundinis]|uniref:Uncharacterized protein n=1 Tax=Apiospora arundinis TaxID=335852 RepID=A0ABR2JMT4_9PEZI
MDIWDGYMEWESDATGNTHCEDDIHYRRPGKCSFDAVRDTLDPETPIKRRFLYDEPLLNSGKVISSICSEIRSTAAAAEDVLVDAMDYRWLPTASLYPSRTSTVTTARNTRRAAGGPLLELSS